MLGVLTRARLCENVAAWFGAPTGRGLHGRHDQRRRPSCSASRPSAMAEQFPLAPQIVAALADGTGPLGRVLQAVDAYEDGEFGTLRPGRPVHGRGPLVDPRPRLLPPPGRRLIPAVCPEHRSGVPPLTPPVTGCRAGRRPGWVMVCRTVLRWRWLVIRPASRSTVACWLAPLAEMFSRLASSEVVQPPAASRNAAARVAPRSVATARSPGSAARATSARPCRRPAGPDRSATRGRRPTAVYRPGSAALKDDGASISPRPPRWTS